ncbi:hypothetical protein NKH77_33270 [Streptomyces sp. M19]
MQQKGAAHQEDTRRSRVADARTTRPAARRRRPRPGGDPRRGDATLPRPRVRERHRRRDRPGGGAAVPRCTPAPAARAPS